MINKSDFSSKVTEIEGKTPNISGLATKTELTAVENKIPSVSNLVKKLKVAEIEKKITDHAHDQYITVLKFNKFSAKVFDERLKRSNLITKTDIDIKLGSLNKKKQKKHSNKTKHLLAENKLKELQTFDSSCFRGKNYFKENGTQYYSVFQ